MIVVPTFIALAFLWHNGSLPWMCWIVAGVGVFAWLCGSAMLNARNDLQKGVTSDRRVFDFWMLTASVFMWVQWILCVVAIVMALAIKRG